jgi:hypothetical protein
MLMSKNAACKHLSLAALLLCAFLLSASPSHASSAILYWDAPTNNEDGTPLTDLDGYWLYYGTSSGYYSNKVNVGNVATYQLGNLAEGHTYYFAVTAYDTSGNESTSSYEVSKTISPPTDTSPPTIQIIDITGITETSATISWTTDEPSTSQVEYGTTPSYGSTTSLDGSLVAGHAQTISGLSPSTLYYFRVSSTDASGNTAVSNGYTFTTATTPDTAPPVISGVAASNIGETSVTISWTTDEPSTSQVEHGTTSSCGSTTSLDGSLVTGHSQTISGLSPSTLYYFRVRSEDANGNAAASVNYSFSTTNTPANVSPEVTSLSADPSSGVKSLTVVFTAHATDPDGSIVQYEWDFEGDGIYDQSTAGNSISYTYYSHGAYTARVRVSDDMGSKASGETTIHVYKNKWSGSDTGSGNGKGNGKAAGKLK